MGEIPDLPEEPSAPRRKGKTPIVGAQGLKRAIAGRAPDPVLPQEIEDALIDFLQTVGFTDKAPPVFAQLRRVIASYVASLSSQLEREQLTAEQAKHLRGVYTNIEESAGTCALCADINVALRRLSQSGDTEMRCEITGNPCGTDTRMEGRPCQCKSCQSDTGAHP